MDLVARRHLGQCVNLIFTRVDECYRQIQVGIGHFHVAVVNRQQSQVHVRNLAQEFWNLGKDLYAHTLLVQLGNEWQPLVVAVTLVKQTQCLVVGKLSSGPVLGGHTLGRTDRIKLDGQRHQLRLHDHVGVAVVALGGVTKLGAVS